MNDDIIILPSEEEKEQAKAEFRELMNWSKSLTAKQIDFLCDGGWYNNAIRGYLITACRNAELTDEQTKQVLVGLNWALSEKNKADAEQISNKY